MMQQVIQNPFSAILSKTNRIRIWIGVFALIIGLSVFQDYLFSQIRNTAFYISDSLLYNSIWAFLFPLTCLEIKLLPHFPARNKAGFVFLLLLVSGLLTLLHIVLFTSFFVSVSHFVFSPPHRFIRIFNTALSNEFSILALYYLSFPILSKFFKKPAFIASNSVTYLKSIKVKKGLKTICINTQAIEIISTDKPYTIIITGKNNFFDNRTLKDFQTILNPTRFIRVNRSTIINKHFVKEVVSRKNGDYDALLHNNKTVRLSRHYRVNWLSLLH
ncbi:MAG: LytTR family transcriptional regulator [Balneolales bacterium]|nr:LytTR family transcriptional regulator [Balneolales bacterium]